MDVKVPKTQIIYSRNSKMNTYNNWQYTELHTQCVEKQPPRSCEGQATVHLVLVCLLLGQVYSISLHNRCLLCIICVYNKNN